MSIFVNDGTETLVEISRCSAGCIMALNRNEFFFLPYDRALEEVVLPSSMRIYEEDDGTGAVSLHKKHDKEIIEEYASALGIVLSTHGISKEHLIELLEEGEKPFDWF